MYPTQSINVIPIGTAKPTVPKILNNERILDVILNQLMTCHCSSKFEKKKNFSFLFQLKSFIEMQQ